MKQQRRQMDFSLSADDLLRLLSTSSLATTVERVQAAIEQAVALGIFPHGRLPAERKLSTALGVSRSAIRAGLEAVRESGYIENSLLGRSGGAPTRVSPLLPSAEIGKRATEAQAEIRELMSTRQIVEPSCARAAANSNDQVLIDRMIESQRVLAEERSALAHRVTDSDFHLAIAFASRSKEAIGVVLRTRADLHEMARSFADGGQDRRNTGRSRRNPRCGDQRERRGGSRSHVQPSPGNQGPIRQLFEIAL